jgi:hypothetical protein
MRRTIRLALALALALGGAGALPALPPTAPPIWIVPGTGPPGAYSRGLIACWT